MEIKKYTARSASQALQRIRQDFGHDAVIISSQELARHTGQARYEIIAAGTPRDGAARTFSSGQAPSRAPAAIAPVPIAPIVRPKPRETEPPPPRAAALPSESMGRLFDELSAVRSQIVDLHSRLRPEPAGPEIRTAPAGDLLERLTGVGIHPEVSGWLVRQIGQGPVEDLVAALEPFVPETQPLPLSDEAPRMLALVGPTGVGKSTTLAKIASHVALEENRRVALISWDPQRAGTDSLGMYARLLGVPFASAATPRELHAAIRRCLDRHLILIDTAGRSHHNKKQMLELQEALSGVPGMHTALVLHASTPYEDLKDITRAYEPLGINRCIVTKMDETRRHGNLLNIAVVVEKPICFWTNGQRVPEDLHPVLRADVLRAALDPWGVAR